MSYSFYIRRDSIVHSLNPVTKIALSTVLATLPWFSPNLGVGLVIMAVIVAFMWLSKVSWSMLKMYWQVFMIILTILTLTWLVFFQMPGTEIFRLTILKLGDLEIRYVLTWEQLHTWARMVVRIVSIAMATALLLATTTQRELVYGLRRIGLPYVPCIIIALTLRFIPLAFGDLETIISAQKCRGLKMARVNIFKRVTHIARALVPLVALSLSRIETMSNALDARGFRLRSRKASYLKTSVSTKDYLVFSILALLAILTFLPVDWVAAPWARP